MYVNGDQCPAPGGAVPGHSVTLAFTDTEFQIAVAFTPAFLDALQRSLETPEQSSPKSLATTEKAAQNPERPNPIPNGIAGPQAGSIDLLLDVELPVSVSFGRAQLPLKEVIKLTTGSIVELNRTVSEPVEVIVNNCVIARGQVVVVEGNFGIRIEHVVSRQERLRTLK